MEDEIEQLKSVLRSLVVSSPTQVDVRSLMRDYRNMIGSPVPLRKYGYSNPVDFLKDRFSDCFLFSGVTSNPVLTLIVPDTLKHIDKFVQKQKSSSTSKFNPKRRSVPEELVNHIRDKNISKTQKHLISQPIEKSYESQTKSFSNIHAIKSHESVNKPKIPLTKSFVTVSKANISCSKYSETSKVAIDAPCTGQTRSNGDVNVLHKNGTLEYKEGKHSKVENAPSDSTNAVKNFLKKRLPLYNSQQNLNEESTEQCSKTVQDDDSGRNTCSSGSSVKAHQLEQLKQEIMRLIADAPAGVWCTDLIKLYKERYNRELNFSRFGYTSIISLMYCLEQGVQITRPDATGDWLLQHCRRGSAPSAAPRPRPRLLRPAPPAHQKPATDSDDALPGIDFDSDVFPEDCMHFMESIESVSVSDFRPGAMVEVMVGEVYSPSHFWFIRLGDNYNIAMEDMMDDMSRYYRNEGRDRVLARGAVRVGHYCSSVYEKDWHRSLIVKIIDSDTVKVRHIDYGTVDTVAVGALKPLRRQWALLPAQACRARLAGVRPSAQGWRWPHAACTAFLALVSDKRLVANVVAVDERDRVSEVLLIDTASDEDVCIGTELTRAGHADARHDSALRTPDVYLFPRFEALESGATPNYAEVHAYLRDGIALDCVRAYRDHVPHPPPLAPPDPPSPPSPPSPPDPTEGSGVPIRIPLLLPDTVSTSAPEPPLELETEPGGAGSVVEPAPPTRTTERPTPGPPAPGPPPPTSLLSPLAPAYVPGAPYAAGYGPPPPPPPPPAGVPLSAAECEVYRALSHVNPAAAHWFLVGAMGRAPALPALRPPHFAPPLSHMHPPVRLHPPPGFGPF